MMNPEKVLPPGVNGKITGYLMVKVDEVFWTRNSPGEVFVELQWWGEKDSTLFRPEDITSNEPKKGSSMSVTYNIRTSPGLFESYLRNCGRITFTVLRGLNKNVILGSAVVKEVEQIISLKNYHSYFSIFSPKGNRIGDLHICFELTFKHDCGHFKARGQGDTNKIKKDAEVPNGKCRSANCQEDELISNIIHKGHELRKAMIMSVLADSPVDSLESVTETNSNPNLARQNLNAEEVKLVDFLLGKHMSPEEELKALKTLRCISPSENLVEIAKLKTELPQVSKSKCCLHGQECTKKKSNPKVTEPKPSTPSLESCFSSLDNEAKTVEKMGNHEVNFVINKEAQLIQDKTEVKKKKEIQFNCYRIIVSSLKLSRDGSRKIFYIPGMKDFSKNNVQFGRNHNPPGTSFILEIALPSNDKGFGRRNIKLITKNFKNLSVYFNQGTTHRLLGGATWTRVCSILSGSVFTLYWRHLNQRLPCPLGSAKLEELNPEIGINSMSLCLPVYSNTRLLTGHLNVTISLGSLETVKDEAVFHFEKKSESSEEQYPLPSPEPIKESVEPYPSPSKSSIPPVSDSDDIFPVPSLDEELMRTIDLLNSKPGDKKEKKELFTEKREAFVQQEPPTDKHEAVAPKEPIIERHEAFVQTTLPLVENGCPRCHRQLPLEENSVEDHFIKNSHNEENREEKFEEHYLKSIPITGKAERLNDHRKFTFSKNNASEHYFHPFTRYPGSEPASEVSCLPMDFENEVVHEFTIKIEKVFGIPLFTGDNDLDCYIDYNFPKLDYSGKMFFDLITNATDIRMALRDTEFRTVTRHRLRLKCKLTKALMSLPVHEITFNIWGRFYRPRPRDYRLGKATIPLMRLSTLELVYCQQMKREPIFEKIIIPISVVDSSMTHGYSGYFGELHVILGYSCASSMSYREWKERERHPNNFHDHPNSRDFIHEGCYKDSTKDSIHRENSKGYKSEGCGNILFPDRIAPSSERIQNSRINMRNRHLETSEFVQSNMAQKGNNDKAKEFQNTLLDVPRGIEESQINDYEVTDVRGLHSKINVNDGTKNIQAFNKLNEEHPYSEPRMVENVVEGVLMDMKERQIDKNKSKSPVFTINSNPLVGSHSPDPGARGDAFHSFDLRVDLPSRRESVDFEARSQCSFMCSPPPIFPYIPNQNINIVLESDSSSTMKDKFREENPINPFSSLSNASFSINSNTSMFKEQQADYTDNPKDARCKKNVSPNNEDIVKESNSLTGHVEEGPSLFKKHKQVNHKNKRVQKNTSVSSYSEKENILSSSGTLKSVESLRSYKEELGGRESKDIAVETEFLTDNKNTQTSYGYDSEEQYFKAQVEICRALGLPSVEVRQPDGTIALVKPTSYAYFSAVINGKQKIFKTQVVEKKSNPIWNASWNLSLPVDLLKKCDRELEIFVDISGGGEEPARGSNCSSQWPIVLRTGVDLTPITAGLESASGWFSLSDRALFPRAQLKVIVTPLEEVAPFRDDWLKEYTKTKGRKFDTNRQHSSSIATSLQEKLRELEKLTERMRDKMDDRPNWNKSPPFDLLSEVQDVNISHGQDVHQRWADDLQKVETATSPIIVDSSASYQVVEDEEEDKSVVQTYTVNDGSESSQHDSLETPSETIDRILSKVRSKR